MKTTKAQITEKTQVVRKHNFVQGSKFYAGQIDGWVFETEDDEIHAINKEGAKVVIAKEAKTAKGTVMMAKDSFGGIWYTVYAYQASWKKTDFVNIIHKFIND